MTQEIKHQCAGKMYGIDADIETSLCEYGLLVAPFTDEKFPKPDEYFCIYKVSESIYDGGYTTEIELNNIIEGKEWANKQDIEGFLSFVGVSKEEWLKTAFVNKLHGLIQYWGYENIFGSTYWEGMLTEEVKERFL